MKRFWFWLLQPRWIVDSEGCMALRLCTLGLNLVYYKWPEPLISRDTYSFADKREFGETVKSQFREKIHDPR